jgi:hypothetical protein
MLVRTNEPGNDASENVCVEGGGETIAGRRGGEKVKGQSGFEVRNWKSDWL